MNVTIPSGGVTLQAYLARPPAASAPTTVPPRGLVVCHGFPTPPRGASVTGVSYPQLADNLAASSGWGVLTFNFRGTGGSSGDFSLNGWLADLAAACDHLLHTDSVSAVWVAGFGVGGALAICAAATHDTVRGVASLGAPADFDDWAANPSRFLAHCRDMEVIRKHDFPPDVSAWAAEFKATRPIDLIDQIPPRPILLVHGTEDDIVPVTDARALADGAAGELELRILAGAGQRLRHDPRAIALLAGWLDRQEL